MRTQIAEKFAPTTEIVCIADQIHPGFESIDWLQYDDIKIGDRLIVAQLDQTTGINALRAENKSCFHPVDKFHPVTSFLSLELHNFNQSDVGRKIEIKGKHYLQYSEPYGAGDKIFKVEPRTTKTYTIVRVNTKSLALDYASKLIKESVRLSFTTNSHYNASPLIRFK
jgi:hypothetical protein